MRVIAGEFKGRKLFFPTSKDEIRPATDRLKETIFNVLGQDLTGLSVLDLFAGVGSLGIEALSRGALHATLVDSGRTAASYIGKNLAHLGLGSRAELLQMEAGKALALLEKRGKKFDVIFIDPPYSRGLVKMTLLEIDRSDILLRHGWLVTEHIKHEEIPTLRTVLLHKTKKYGVTRLSFLFKVEGANKNDEDVGGICGDI